VDGRAYLKGTAMQGIWTLEEERNCGGVWGGPAENFDIVSPRANSWQLLVPTNFQKPTFPILSAFVVVNGQSRTMSYEMKHNGLIFLIHKSA
jgi:hypothetical protein